MRTGKGNPAILDQPSIFDRIPKPWEVHDDERQVLILAQATTSETKQVYQASA
jgi:hypothetical protein